MSGTKGLFNAPIDTRMACLVTSYPYQSNGAGKQGRMRLAAKRLYQENYLEALIEQSLGSPLLLAALLFVATFVLEEAAILLAAGLAASGEMTSALALASVGTGMIVSDWCLYGLGALAARSRRIADWVSRDRLEQGRRLLHRSTFAAGLLARIIPWLLFPVFVASGFLRVGFRRFAMINAIIALVYVPAVFYGAFGLYAVLMEWLGDWAWMTGAVLLLAILWGGRAVARRYLSGTTISEG
ncbi:DedA family protein [Paracoccus sp. (in: a-proteobacteria)]|uniref:DedA family protein n=1 Tax=Paracoccus sp. TaxID=267 RepID=UPI00396C67C9